MSALKNLKTALDELLGSPARITAAHLEVLAPLLDRATVIGIIDDVLSDAAAFEVIANRSYTHSLGFRKITLLEPEVELAGGRKGGLYQVRLHIWQPGDENTVPLVESKHEHSFDFISRVLIGEMENQCYTMHDLDDDDRALLQRLLARLDKLEREERVEANRLIEALEAERLAGFGSDQAANEAIVCDRERFCKLLEVEAGELNRLVGLAGRYEYDVKASVFGGKYVHSLTRRVKLDPHGILKLRPGDLYHHGHDYVHRLYMAAQKANATIIVTTPVFQGANGASFQHPTWFAGDDVSYERRMYTQDELRAVMTAFRAQLALAPVADGRLLDVAAI